MAAKYLLTVPLFMKMVFFLSEIFYLALSLQNNKDFRHHEVVTRSKIHQSFSIIWLSQVNLFILKKAYD